MNRYIDVTVPLSSAVPTFPGDPRFEMDFAHRIADGKPYNVARIQMGVHSATHIDAPFHFIDGGATVDELPLEILIGKCRVLEIADRERVERAELEAADLRNDIRLLLKTRMSGQLKSPDFQEDFVHLTPAAAEYLVQAGIKLIGIDYLSIERFGSASFEAHHALLGAGVIVVEGLDLSEAEAGDYDLICLPLRIAGADGAPARVVLRRRV